MKQLFVLLLLLCFISCKESKPAVENIENKELTSDQIDSILVEYEFDYESPIVIDNSTQVMLPISTSLLERRSYYSEEGYYSADFPRYWNVLFFDRKTGETRLLTENKVRISQIHANLSNEYNEANRTLIGKILYEIVDVDFNRDGVLNSTDPEALFSSDYNGTNLKRISPINENLQFFEVVPNSNQILIRTLRDHNQDSIFNQKDESIWYKAELIEQDWILNEIIDASGRKKIENLYFDQWIKKTKKVK
ncbi:hypothetical protein [Flammeovirga aprica]|uniref:Uncharacterized protein n=1 Tax=Flammeovirga aprica JL-4 TaxID=694437 RepID=A0A7X9P3K0_9BACT|nr:hypothetical protein [Flammeovirga aprica]NME68593.1 hypothetical protein [Flammeovirga aprica JL-4]